MAYLAFVLDVFSRMLLTGRSPPRLHTDLEPRVLDMGFAPGNGQVDGAVRYLQAAAAQVCARSSSGARSAPRVSRRW